MLPVCTGPIPGHQRHGPDGLSFGQPGQAPSRGARTGCAWVVPAAGPKGASPRLPDTSRAVPNDLIRCFIVGPLDEGAPRAGHAEVAADALEDSCVPAQPSASRDA